MRKVNHIQGRGEVTRDGFTNLFSNSGLDSKYFVQIRQLIMKAVDLPKQCRYRGIYFSDCRAPGLCAVVYILYWQRRTRPSQSVARQNL